METALPDYSVRHSPKAKNLRLKVTREDGLVVVIPKRYDEKKIPSLLSQKKVWIADALKRIGETRRFLEPTSAMHFPDAVRMVALGETWPITYRQEAKRFGVRLRADNGNLFISGSDLTREIVIRKLKDWLRLKVREDLFPLAEKLAAKHHLKIGGLLARIIHQELADVVYSFEISYDFAVEFQNPRIQRPHRP